MKAKVVVTDFIGPPMDLEQQQLEDLAVVEGILASNEDQVVERARDADALIVWHTMKLTQRSIRALERCRGIVRAGVGYDNVDLSAAGERGIYVCNVPDYGVDEVADHSMALMLTLLRKVYLQNPLVKSGGWSWERGRPIPRLKGKTLGIVGLGRIGSATALRAKAFGMKIVEYDPYIPDGKEKSLGVEAVDFDTLLRTSDVVSIHTPLTDETRHMFDGATLRKMKPTAMLINTARGPIVDTDALTQALREGWIAGAGLDVMEVEPPDFEHPLFKMDSLVVTPHTAFYSEESLVEVRIKAAREVARILKGEKPRNPVNMEFILAS